MKSDLLLAVTQLAAERSLPQPVVLSAIREALVSAYKRDSSSAGQDVLVDLDPDTGEMQVRTVKTVVPDESEIEDPKQQITLAEAQKLDREATPGQYVITGQISTAPGRIAAQTAKQVVMQRLREAERELVFHEFEEKVGEIMTVTVQRADGGHGITVDLGGRAEGIMPPSEQIPNERYRPGYKIKVYIVEVRRGQRGPEIVASRTHPDLIRRLFEAEVPEIYNGIVEIVGIAREPGARSKVAVQSRQPGVDAVGACVGLRGIRIQNVVNELHGEKIDVVEYNEDPTVFIASSLSPARVESVTLNWEEDFAFVVVPDDSLSLAIGRDGQNARLAAKLTDWRVDIRSATEAAELAAKAEAQDLATRAIEEEAARRAAAAQESPEAAEAETSAPAAPERPTEPVEAPAQPESAPEPAVADESVTTETPEVEAAAAAETEEQPVASEEALAAAEASASQTEAEPAAAETGGVQAAAEEPLFEGAGQEETSEAPASAEEELALRALEEEIRALEEQEAQQREAEEEAAETIDFSSDDIWKVPELESEEAQGELRFAEDIVGYRDESGSRRRGRGRRGGDNLSPKARRAAARRAREQGQGRSQ